MTDSQPALPLELNPEDIHIRPAVRSDLHQIEWEGAYQRFRRVYADVFARANSGLAIMWVAETNTGKLAGQAFVQLKMTDQSLADGHRRAYLHSFRVRPEYQGKGLGTAILKYVEADLTQRGFQELTLNVAEDNPGAIRLYQHLNYHILKRIPGRWSYYDDRGHFQQVTEPGYRMIKQLGK